jgi:hypothetical protein
MHKFKHELKYNKTWANNIKKKKGSKQCIQQGGLNGKQQHNTEEDHKLLANTKISKLPP